jgi:tetratricopeptide (TPR) repeat protein
VIWRVPTHILVVALTLLAAGHGMAEIDPVAQPTLQLFSSVDRSTAAVGESFVLEVEFLASPENEEEIAELKAAFHAASLEVKETGLTILRERPAVYEQTTVRFGAAHGDVPVMSLRRRFVLRGHAEGALRTPPFTVTFRNVEYSTESHTVAFYRLAGESETIRRSVLPIVSETALDAQNQRVQRIGSGFIVGSNLLVTSYHVVVNAARIRAQMPDGRRVNIKRMWAVDPVRDVAVLYISPRLVEKYDLAPLSLAAPGLDFERLRSDAESRRGVVFTMGWPDGVQQTRSGLLFESGQEYQYDALWISSNRVRPGDSGGPLLDDLGRVLGVVSYALVSDPTNDAPLTSITVATDPRPVLAMQMLADRPRTLRWFRRQTFFETEPHARAIRASTRIGEYSLRGRATRSEGLGNLLEELDLAVAVRPSETSLHYIRGTAYQMIGAFDRASESYRETLRRESRHYPAAYSLAYCALAMRGLDEAEELFELSAEFEPYEHLAAYGLAQTRMRMLQYDAAADLLRRILHHHSRFSPGLYMLGRAYAALGDVERVAQLVAKLSHIDRRWASMLVNTVTHPLYRPVTYSEIPRAGASELGLDPEQ